MNPIDGPSLHSKVERPLHTLGLSLLLVLLTSSAQVSLARAADDTAIRLANVSSTNTAYVRVANDPAFSLQQFTLEAWVQRVGDGYGFSTDPSGAAIVAKPREGMSGSNIASWHLHWTNAGQVHFNLTHTVGSSGVYLLSSAVATPLARHHLAVSFDGATIRIYIDGALSGQAPWNLGTVYYGPDDVLIGADNFALGYFRRFDGYIDDVRIWDHARTPGEIAAFMNCRLSGNESGLVAYWTFDGSDLSDATGHGHVGTIGGLAGSLTYAPLAALSSCALVGVTEPPATIASSPMVVFPQPTRGPVTVRFDLPREALVTVELFDVAGRNMGTLTSKRYAAGPHEIVSDVTTLGAEGSSGLFFLRLVSEGKAIARPLVLLR